MKKPFVSAQVDGEDNAKLERLARLSQRSKSDVLRLLIRSVDERQFMPQAINVDVQRTERAA